MKNKLDLKNLSNEELINKLKEQEEGLFKLRFDLMLGKLKKTHLLKLQKRNLARILTELNRRTREKLILKGEENGKKS